MKIIIETCLNNLFIVLLSKDNKLLTYCKEPIQKKGDALPVEYKKLLEKVNKQTKDLTAIYVTKGPGSFTGARVGLIFAKTICQVLKIALFTIDTLSFISKGKEGTYFIDAKSGLSYQGTLKNQKMHLELTKYQKDTEVDYEDIIKNPEKYLKLFNKVKNIAEEKVVYIKEPQVGG